MFLVMNYILYINLGWLQVYMHYTYRVSKTNALHIQGVKNKHNDDVQQYYMADIVFFRWNYVLFSFPFF